MRSTATERLRGSRRIKAKNAVFARDCGICQVCKANGKITSATELDHIVPYANGGTDDYDNLQAICHDCHADKTARENGKRRRVAIGADGWPI